MLRCFNGPELACAAVADGGRQHTALGRRARPARDAGYDIA